MAYPERADLFSLSSIELMNSYSYDFTTYHFQLFVLTCAKPRQQSFLKLILLLSGDIESNPGPDSHAINLTQNAKDIWSPFKSRGLHFIHLNINSLLPKIDELRNITYNNQPAVVRITESKLDSTVLDAEVEIQGYSLIRADRNRHGGGVACYIRNTINYKHHPGFSKDLENVVVDLLLPNSKPILVGIFYNPPNKSGFLGQLSQALTLLAPGSGRFIMPQGGRVRQPVPITPDRVDQMT